MWHHFSGPEPLLLQWCEGTAFSPCLWLCWGAGGQRAVGSTVCPLTAQTETEPAEEKKEKILIFQKLDCNLSKKKKTMKYNDFIQ